MAAIGIAGVTGRMGRALLTAVEEQSDVSLAGGSVRPGSVQAGQPIKRPDGSDTGLFALDDDAALFARSDIVIDFTGPEAAKRHACLAAETGKPLVIGTTGLDRDTQAAVAEASRQAAIVQTANFSLGVNLLLAFVDKATRSLGPDFDIEILEMHHRYKADAPSGTALALGEAAAAARGVQLDGVADKIRDGRTGPRKDGAIGFATLRGGDVAGEHSVIFAGMGERVELSHKASDRVIFARGAVRAALWLQGRSAGLYSMRDVLGI